MGMGSGPALGRCSWRSSTGSLSSPGSSRTRPPVRPDGRIAGMSTEPHGHTHRLDLADSTVREWDATVLAVDPEQGIVLDRSAFYPGGGGQPPDEGVLLWGGVRTRIAGTRKG